MNTTRISYGIMIAGLVLVIVSLPLLAQEIDDVALAPKKKRSVFKIAKPTARIDEAIGVMSKGQLCNLTMNYGQITDTRLEDVGNAPTDDFYNFRYPRTKPYGSMVDDFAICFAVKTNTKNGNNGNFIDGYTANGNEDWIAKNGSLGATHYDGSGADEMLVYVDGTTPYLAASDIPQTWPIDSEGNHFWPGYFRRDRETGYVYEGEFVSDRDVYAVFNDASNVQGNSLGVEIEQMAYCYGRPYAEDFQFYEFFIHNTSSTTIDSAWFGIYQDPDCSDYGQEILIMPAGHSFSDDYPILMQRDFDGDIGAATEPNSLGRLEDMDYGVIYLETPNNLGITDFHYFTDSGPTSDEDLWPIISSQPNDSDIIEIKSEFFHGLNTRLDDVNLITSPFDLVYIAGSGPFSLAPGDTLKFTIAVVVGDTDDDFMINCDMAISMFEKGFVGPSAPPGPEVSAVPGDQCVTLYWDNSPEMSADPATGVLDFEGYKIYRSEDGGVTWGDEITDYQGVVIGYVPIAQFDLENDIQGLDPITPTNYLGANTGLRYTFIDSTVYNGIEYSYTVTSFDQGDVVASIPSYETAKGTSEAEANFVSVVPAPVPIGYLPAEIAGLAQVAGKGQGSVEFDIIDSDKYLAYKAARNYIVDPIFKIIFDGFPAARFALLDSTDGNTVLYNGLEINSDTPYMLADLGITIAVESEQKIGGIEDITDETGLSILTAGTYDNTNSWSVTTGIIGSSAIDARSNNYEIRFTDNGSMAYSKHTTAPVAIFPVPFEVWQVRPDSQQIICEVQDKDLDGQFSAKDIIYLVTVVYPDQEPSIGESNPVTYPANFPLQIVYNTNPDGGDLPVTGQKTIINCYSSYSDGSGFNAASEYARGDMIVFGINDPDVDNSLEKEELQNIKVVPNPYVVTSLFDPMENVNSLKFMYLPEACEITIYSMSGVQVKRIKHENGTGIENWNLTNDFGQEVAFGVYYYLVTTPGGDQAAGKLAIIR